MKDKISWLGVGLALRLGAKNAARRAWAKAPWAAARVFAVAVGMGAALSMMWWMVLAMAWSKGASSAWVWANVAMLAAAALPGLGWCLALGWRGGLLGVVRAWERSRQEAAQAWMDACDGAGEARAALRLGALFACLAWVAPLGALGWLWGAFKSLGAMAARARQALAKASIEALASPAGAASERSALARASKNGQAKKKQGARL